MDVFNINKIFISSFLNMLWNYPEAIYHILINSECEIVKTNLAPFIVNNFYCNHLSGNYMENNLLYIITLMLKDEIDKLENIDQVDTFLENTKCGFLLEELRKLPDIQIYFKNVILKTVEKIERTCSFRKINLNVEIILQELLKLKEEEDKSLDNNDESDKNELYKKVINKQIVDLSINYSKEGNDKKCSEQNILFVEKFSPNMGIKEFEEKAKKAKKENKNNLFEYFNKLANNIKLNNNEKLYANNTLMQNLLETDLAAYMLSFYQVNFLEVVSFIEQLIEDLMKNILILPNSIKYICKIISILIKKKFKDISAIDENAFISKFFLEKLLIPIISFPSFNALISDFIISENTIKNIKEINFILKKLFSGKLFQNNDKEGDYTPFNWIFLDKMENILYFFEKAIKVNLPTFIDNCINDKLPKNYLYEYFNENKEQIYTNISICFNYDNLYYLVKGFKKNDTLFNNNIPKSKKLQKSLSRLKSDETMNEIKTIDEERMNQYKENLNKSKKEKEQQISIDNYYLYNAQIIEKKYNNLFTIDNKITNFFIDIKKLEENRKLDENDKNIIKLKNYLCNSLGNYRLLNKSDFNIESTTNTIKLLNEIKCYLSLPNFILGNSNIPSIWYLNSVLDYLNKIPDDYRENDFQKLFNELKQNLKDSINALDFEKLVLFRKKLNFLDKMNNYYDNVKELYNDILINENIKNVVENAFIPVEINFKYDNKEQLFELNKSNIKEKVFNDKIIIKDSTNNIIIFKTIESFSTYFPKINKYQLIQGINPFNIIQKLSINKKINNYFDIIKEKIIQKYFLDVNIYNSLYDEKIKSYIMNKLYDKIYPQQIEEKDTKIFQKTISLCWVEPKLFIEKDYIFHIMLPDILNEFKQLNIVKSPHQKVKCIKSIMGLIEKLIKFNEREDKEIGAEDIGPVLNYIFIKVHPIGVLTDLEYIKLFYENNGKYEICITNFENIYKYILDFNGDTFNMNK